MKTRLSGLTNLTAFFEHMEKLKIILALAASLAVVVALAYAGASLGTRGGGGIDYRCGNSRYTYDC
jgi:hypothetical protein